MNTQLEDLWRRTQLALSGASQWDLQNLRHPQVEVYGHGYQDAVAVEATLLYMAKLFGVNVDVFESQ